MYLIDLFFQIESKFNCSQRSGPFSLGRTVDGGQHNSSTTKILICHEFLSMLVFFLCRMFKEVGEAFEGHVIAIVIRSLEENNFVNFQLHKKGNTKTFDNSPEPGTDNEHSAQY